MNVKIKQALDGQTVEADIIILLEQDPAAFFNALTKRKLGPRRLRRLKEMMADKIISVEKRNVSLFTGLEWYRLIYKVCKLELDLE